MKKIRLFLILIFVISLGSSFQQIVAQDKTKTDSEEELRIKEAIDAQKKAMADHKKAKEEVFRIIQENGDADKDLKDIQVQVEVNDSTVNAPFRYHKRGMRSFSFDEPFVVSPEMNDFWSHSFGGDAERTTWEFSRSVKENTFSRDYTFDVEKTAKKVVMSVMGDCKAGEIRIRIVMPNGNNYSDIVIDESGNLNWRKSFAISDTENQDKEGSWKFQIDSSKATGFFKISLQTY
jgi:hypothetical protein